MTRLKSVECGNTRARILATTRKLTISASFEQVAVREIASDADMATRTIISIFGTKGDLLLAIVEEDLTRLLPLSHASTESHDGTSDRILAICLTCAAYHVNQIAILRATMAASWTFSADDAKRVQAAIKPMLELIIRELNRGIGRGELRSDMIIPLTATMILETVVNSFRDAIYGEVILSDLENDIKQRLNLLLQSISAATRSQQDG